MPQPSYTNEDIVHRGEALYERRIRPEIKASDRGKFLAVDIETGKYVVDGDELLALKRAKAKNPDAVLYMLRIGYPTAYRLGRTGSVNA